MKKIAFIVLCFCQITFAQNNRSIAGVVINQKTQETIPFVSVLLKNGDKIKTSITNENGKFIIEGLQQSKYVLIINAIGYVTHKQIVVFGKNPNINLKNIGLKENIEALNEVVVRAETSSVIQKVDRVVIQVGKDLTSIGSDASEVLNNVQSVSVDQQTGELSLRGNTNVKVLVDGKPTNIPTEQLLQQIPSSAIKNIELITNPSAKYNPEGNSGIINIELIKNSRLGLHGSVSLSSQYGKNFRHTGGININYKKKNINWYGNYNLKKGEKNVIGKITRFDPSIVQTIDGFDDSSNHLVKFGNDIDLSKKTSIGISTTQSFRHLDYVNKTQLSDTPTGPITSNNQFSFTRKPYNQTYHFNIYQTLDEKDHIISLETMMSKRTAPENSLWTNTITPTDAASNYTEILDKGKNLILLNLDYAKPFSKNSSLEAGLELREDKTESTNNSTQKVLDSNSADAISGLSEFTYNRKIYAAYINYKNKFGKFVIQTGLRAESYHIDGTFHADVDDQNTIIKQKINSLYPSFFTTYELNKKDQLQFSYSRRVDRPSIKQVTPIRSWGTPLVTSRGNPDLKQQFTNSLELRYNRKIKKGNFSTTIFFRNLQDDISRTLSVDPNVANRAILSYGNFDNSNNYGVEFSAYVRLKKWWSLNTSLDFYNQKQRGIIAKQYTTVNNNRFNYRINNTFKTTDKLSFQLSGLYRGESENLQRVKYAMYMVNTGANYRILKDKGTLSLGVSDVFNTFGFRFKSLRPFNQVGEFRWESQKISLRFVYNFGVKPKEKRRKSRQKSGEDTGNGGGMF